MGGFGYLYVKGKPAGYSDGEPGALAVASRRKKDKTDEMPRIFGIGFINWTDPRSLRSRAPRVLTVGS